ncbi:ATP-binding protein [Paenibacillus sp. YYML68]|uniref:ATP-binding protein n=1 Tax=Paenibacillus sp. YYML68 TaxID=2909250 RepID=UPI0037C59B89
MDGTPLSEYIRDSDLKPSLEKTLRVAIRLVQAIERLHLHKHVHLAISPNAFFLEARGRDCLLLSLFRAAPFATPVQRLARERALSAAELELMHYLAPELAGQLYSSADARIDLYAIGVLLYRMLSGAYPLEGQDATKLAYLHMAVEPKPLTELGIPRPVSDIVMKCLEKHPEQRYWSAAALNRDLVNVLARLFDRPLEPSKLPGTAPDQLIFAEAMYGREAELNVLHSALSRAGNGSKEIIFISGNTGIGKSYLVHEFHKCVQSECLFVSGNFDPFQRNDTYAVVHQVGRQLLADMLLLDDYELSALKQRIADAVSPNGQVLLDLNPGLEQVLGTQPPLAELGRAEAHERFMMTLQQYISVFTKRERPLVVFIDDLQWADSGFIQLMLDFVSRDELRSCVFIFTFRDRDITASHPLRGLLEKLQLRNESCLSVKHLRLEPLKAHHVELLLEDALYPAQKPISTLSSLFMDKAKGSPFYTKQLCRSLFDQQLLWFDHANSCWAWDEAIIQELHISDNVTDNLYNQIGRQPKKLQLILMYAACIGQQFSLQTLMLLTKLSREDLIEQLDFAVKEGLLHALTSDRISGSVNPAYKFLQERVYQAAYSMLQEDRRQEIHLHIGQLYEKNEGLVPSCRERTFEIANQLNHAAALIKLPHERYRLAAVNLRACLEAKSLHDYSNGLRYAAIGLQLLPVDAWDQQYELSFSLQLEKAELEYLCGQFEEAKLTFASVLQQARTKLEKADAYNRMIVLYTNMSQHNEALRIGLEGLQLLGFHIPSTISRTHIVYELVQSFWHRSFRSMDDLLELPAIHDPAQLTIIRFLVSMIAPSYLTNSNLYIYLMLRMFNYSLKHGHAEGSALSYSSYGVIMSALFGLLNTGQAFGQIALRLEEVYPKQSVRSKLYFKYGAFTHQLQEHLDHNVERLKKAYRDGSSSGNFIYAGYAIVLSCFLQLTKGDRLDVVLHESEQYTSFIQRTPDKDIGLALTMMQRFMLYLGQTQSRTFPYSQKESIGRSSLLTEEETSHIESLTNYFVVHLYYLLHSRACFIMNDLKEAQALLEKAELMLKHLIGCIQVHYHHYLYAMVLCGLFQDASAAERKQYKAKIQFTIRFLSKWSKHSPDNFKHLLLLVEAEWHRAQHHTDAAATYYMKAIDVAKMNRFLHDEATANECAAKYYIQLGNFKAALPLLTEAHRLYASWGARRKISALEASYPFLISQTKEQGGAPERSSECG